MNAIQLWFQQILVEFRLSFAGSPLPLAASPDAPHVLFSQNGGSDEKRTVRAGRRRSDGSSAGERERADAPTRDRPSGGSSSGGGSSSARPPSVFRPGGGGLPGGRRGSPLLLIAILLILLVCVGPFYLFGGFGGDEQSSAPPSADAPAVEPAAPTRPPRQPTPTRQPGQVAAGAASAGGPGDRWLVMLYQDADDKILEQDIYVDLNEAERVGSTDNVTIVTQVDRFRGGYGGDGDWTSAKRFYVTQDDDLRRVASQEVADLGEVNMADGATLVDFVVWAMETYPADKYALVMADHGMGWPGGWSDPTASGRGDRSLPLAQSLGDQLYLHELDQALSEIRSRTGVDKLDLIGMDACLMGHVEVFSALAPHARYAVASQETEPALGWAYTGFLQELVANPGMNGADLGRAIVTSYIEDDQRIVDDQARAELVGRSLFGASADQVARQLGQDITLTAFDLSALPALMDSVNNLAYVLQSADQRAVAQARTYAQSFTSIFGSNVPPSYIDLSNFAQILAQKSDEQALASAATQVDDALAEAVVASKQGPGRPGATGVSIYFPNSQLYAAPAAGPQSYTVAAQRFAQESLWDDFLAFHYTGRRFDAAAPTVAAPTRSEEVRSPAAGGIQVSPVTVSSDTAGPGQPILLSADISGDNVGYVKLLVGYVDRQANSLNLIDTDYLDSPDTREIGGVYYPDWGEGEFTLEFEWEPIVFAIDDGETRAVALFNPQSYGLTRAEATYNVNGVYTYGDDGETRPAQLVFRNGVLQQVFGYTGGDGAGAPREILPQPGDRFTVTETWLDLDSQGNVVQTVQEQGKTLTFGDQPFQWRELDAAAGDYIVGFIVEDLDGNQTTTYQPVIVQ